MKSICASIILLIFCLNSFAQKGVIGVITIPLDEKVYPLFNYNPIVQNALLAMMDSAQEATGRNKFLAADYSDGVTKFRLVVLPPAINSSMTGKTYMFYVTPYKCDSVYIGTPSSSSTDISNSPVIGVGKRKFKVTVLPNGKAIQVMDISDKYVAPDARLFEGKLPDIKFPLFYGGTQSFNFYKGKHKLIYLYFWGGIDCKPCLNDFGTLKEIYNVYKNNISIISLLYPDDPSSDKIDTIAVNKVIIDHRLEWVQGFCDLELAGDLFVNGTEYGMLFDEDGNVIKMFVLPDELKEYLKKRYE